MPTLKLTPTTVDRLKAPDPTGTQQIYWDSTLSGFGVLVSGTTSVKSYVVQRKVAGTRRKRRMTLDKTNILTLEQARARAIGMLGEFSAGKDPKLERKREALSA